MFSLIKLFYIQTKELFKMTFTTDSSVAKSYALLILAGKYMIEQVPDVGNLREVVIEILTT